MAALNRFTITLPDNIYKLLRASAEQSMRPYTTEAAYLLTQSLRQASSTEWKTQIARSPAVQDEQRLDLVLAVLAKRRPELGIRDRSRIAEFILSNHENTSLKALKSYLKSDLLLALK